MADLPEPHPPAAPAPSPRRGGKPQPRPSIVKARRLRGHMSDEEVILWSELRLLRIQGMHFRRQVPRGPYVLDFACLKAGVAVEVDGVQHYLGDQPRKDAARDAYFASIGIVTLRYNTTEIRQSLNAVVDDIFVRTQARLFPSPPRGGWPEGSGGAL